MSNLTKENNLPSDKVRGNRFLTKEYLLNLLLSLRLKDSFCYFFDKKSEASINEKIMSFIVIDRDFPGVSAGKESSCSVGDLGLILGLGRSPGGGHGNSLQYSCLGILHGLRSLASYSPRSHKESDMTERLSTAQHMSLWTIYFQVLDKKP